jgi:propionyl-CoA synthetase
MSSIYDHAYGRSMSDPESFWASAAEDIVWHRRWDTGARLLAPAVRAVVPGARLNTCENALDVHVARGRGKQRALIYDSPVTAP